METEPQSPLMPIITVLAERIERGLAAIETDLQLIRDGLPALPSDHLTDDAAPPDPVDPPLRGGRWV
jgi:hypothetical protein